MPLPGIQRLSALLLITLFHEILINMKRAFFFLRPICKKQSANCQCLVNERLNDFRFCFEAEHIADLYLYE